MTDISQAPVAEESAPVDESPGGARLLSVDPSVTGLPESDVPGAFIRRTFVIADARLNDAAEDMAGHHPQVLIECWKSGEVTIATRPSPAATWSPPFFGVEAL